jgi:hypothetical protein
MIDMVQIVQTKKFKFFVSLVASTLQIFVVLAAFKKLHGAFEVIVVSLLAIILILVIEAIQQTSDYRLTTSATLHKEFTKMRMLVGGEIDQEADEKIKKALAAREESYYDALIFSIGRLVLGGIIFWNLVKMIQS